MDLCAAATCGSTVNANIFTSQFPHKEREESFVKRLQALLTICGAVGGEFMDAALVEYVALWGQFVQQLSADFDEMLTRSVRLLAL